MGSFRPAGDFALSKRMHDERQVLSLVSINTAQGDRSMTTPAVDGLAQRPNRDK